MDLQEKIDRYLNETSKNKSLQKQLNELHPEATKMLDSGKLSDIMKQALSDIESGEKDKNNKVAMDLSGKNYIYKNVKGKPKVSWNKKIKELVGNKLFAFKLYYEEKWK